MDTSSVSNLETVKSWISECEGHLRCFLPEQVPLPDRVVDVSGQKLCLKETNKNLGQYMCLSYCWRPTRPLTTERDTIHQIREGILWPSIPKTFQDAIIFTRQLGIQYLWIDSLCIIQDDKKDWETQAGQMAQIYGNSYLTIAAVSGYKAEDGLFRKSNEAGLSPLCVPKISHDHPNNGRDIFVRIEPLHNSLVLNKFDSKRPCPLLSRGWVFQEHMLPTRVLQFVENEVVLHCKSETRCECRNGCPKRFGAKAIFHERLLQGIRQSENSRALVLEQWRIAVEQYSHRRLTRTTTNSRPFLVWLSCFKKIWRANILRDYGRQIFWEACGGPVTRSQGWTTFLEVNSRDRRSMLHLRGPEHQ